MTRDDAARAPRRRASHRARRAPIDQDLDRPLRDAAPPEAIGLATAAAIRAACAELEGGPQVQVSVAPVLWREVMEGLRQGARRPTTGPSKRAQLLHLRSRIHRAIAQIPQDEPGRELPIEVTVTRDDAFSIVSTLQTLVFLPQAPRYLRALAQIEGPRLLEQIPGCPAVLRAEVDKLGWRPEPPHPPPGHPSPGHPSPGPARRGQGRASTDPTDPTGGEPHP